MTRRYYRYCLFSRNGKLWWGIGVGWDSPVVSGNHKKKQPLSIASVGLRTELHQQLAQRGILLRDLPWEWFHRHASHAAPAPGEGPEPRPGWDRSARPGAGPHDPGELLCPVGAAEEEEIQRAHARVHGQPVCRRPGGGFFSGQFHRQIVRKKQNEQANSELSRCHWCHSSTCFPQISKLSADYCVFWNSACSSSSKHVQASLKIHWAHVCGISTHYNGVTHWRFLTSRTILQACGNDEMTYIRLCRISWFSQDRIR